MLVISPGETDADDNPKKEFGVTGLLEWNDDTFTVKRETGEVLFQTETRLAHQSIGFGELMATEPEVVLRGPGVELELTVVRKHRQDAIAAVTELIAAAAAQDPGVSEVTRRRGPHQPEGRRRVPGRLRGRGAGMLGHRGALPGQSGHRLLRDVLVQAWACS